jgi:hypothetical protein
MMKPVSEEPLPAWNLVKLDIAGSVLFGAVMAIAVPLRNERPAQIAIAAVSLVLFAVGVAVGLWAYTSALERSRTEEVGVANLFLLTGPTAPRAVKRLMTLALVAQVVIALVGASVGASGLQQGELNALAFGVLVPMFGIGMNGLWAARYGSFGPRIVKAVRADNRKIE